MKVVEQELELQQGIQLPGPGSRIHGKGRKTAYVVSGTLAIIIVLYMNFLTFT